MKNRSEIVMCVGIVAGSLFGYMMKRRGYSLKKRAAIGLPFGIALGVTHYMAHQKDVQDMFKLVRVPAVPALPLSVYIASPVQAK